jgi:hypothetical protein
MTEKQADYEARIEQLTALRDAVRDGRATLPEIRDMCAFIWTDGQGQWMAPYFADASCREDMNAALALKDALLPELRPEIWQSNPNQWGCCLSGSDTVYAPDPARALVLAVLEAMIAKSQSDGLAMPKEEVMTDRDLTRAEVGALIAEAVERATRVKPLVWEADSQDELVTDGYRIKIDGFTLRLWHGEVQLSMARDIDVIARLQSIANKHHERRIRAAIGGNDE